VSGTVSRLSQSRGQGLLSSALCLGFKFLELLFKGAKGLVILTADNIVWFHIHVTGKFLLIHLHLLVQMLGSVYSTASFLCFPAEDALKDLAEGLLSAACGAKHSNVESNAVTEDPVHADGAVLVMRCTGRC